MSVCQIFYHIFIIICNGNGAVDAPIHLSKKNCFIDVDQKQQQQQ